MLGSTLEKLSLMITYISESGKQICMVVEEWRGHLLGVQEAAQGILLQGPQWSPDVEGCRGEEGSSAK